MPRTQKLISVEQRRLVLRLLFGGEEASQVAEKTSLSKYLVGRVLSDFIAMAKESGSILGAAISEGVEDQVNALIELSGEVSKTKMSAEECAKGAKLIGKLQGVGVDDKYLDKFLDEFLKGAQEQSLSPTVLASYNVEFGRLRWQTKKEYGQIVEEYGSKASEVKDLEATIKDLENRRAENQRALNTELDEAKTSSQEIKWFNNTREDLLKDGVDVRELDGLRNIFANVMEKDSNPVAVAEICSKYSSVSARVRELEDRSQQIEKEVSEKNHTLSKLNQEIEKSKALQDSISYLETRHVDSGLVEAIAGKVVEASARMGVTVKEAMLELKKDIDEHYEELHGLRGEVTQLTSRKNVLIVDINGLEERKALLSSLMESKKKALDSLERLRLGGVSEEILVEWDKLITSQGLDVTTFRGDIEGLGGLKAYIEEKTRSKRKLDETIRGIDEEISQRRMELKRLNDGIVSAVDQLNLTTDEVERSRSNLAKEVKNLQSSIKQIGSEAQEAGEAIGRYKDLNVIMLMMSGVEVNVGEGKVATLGLLKAVHDYLQRAGYRHTPVKVQECIEAFRGEITSV